MNRCSKNNIYTICETTETLECNHEALQLVVFRDFNLFGKRNFDGFICLSTIREACVFYGESFNSLLN